MKLQKINVFPLKSLKGIEVNEWGVDEHGLKHDRIYMLTHKRPSGEWIPLTQREEPSMARIIQRFDGPDLALSYEGGPQIRLPLDYSTLPETGENINLKLWGEDLRCGNVTTEEIGKFFVDFFNQSKYNRKNLAVVKPISRRNTPHENEYTEEFIANSEKITTNFQDKWPFTLMTTASYEDLEQHVSIMNESVNINGNSFRMNLLVDADEPWIEDDWRLLTIAGHVFNVGERTERCPIPAIDQEKGEFRESRYPLPALNRFRVLRKGRTPCFGLSMLNKDSGYSLKVGDEIKILEQED